MRGRENEVYIGIGSNSGDRVGFISEALERLEAFRGIHIAGLSHIYETSPVEVEGDRFLNAVALMCTDLSPETLLETLLKVETSLGRRPRTGRKRARTIDLDLLIYGDLQTDESDLTIPHPRMCQRRFVIEPLAELAPGLYLPEAGMTAADLAGDLRRGSPGQEVLRLGTLEEELEKKAASGV